MVEGTKTRMKINQFHSGVAVGDAITDFMFQLRDLIRSHGYESEIFCEKVPQKLYREVRPISDYQGSIDNILLVHHSLGFDVFEKIQDLSDKKILIYHNVTPERFFDNDWARGYARLGLTQLKKYRHEVGYAITDSNFNRQDMLRSGWPNRIDVMPVSMNINRLDKVKADKKLLAKLRGTCNILFVGRIARNKCQEDLLNIFQIYHRIYNHNSRLYLVGDTYGSYATELQDKVDDMELQDAVFLTGKVSEEELKAYYLSADLFLCMSEHEGFCIPLLEAMRYDVPVISYKAAAVPETMDGAGVLVTEKDYDCIAALMDEIQQDKKLRAKIVARQAERMEMLKRDDTEKILFEAIENCLKKNRKKTIQVQGHMESSYSLAAVNRKLSEALYAKHFAEVSILNTDGWGGETKQPSFREFADKDRAKRMWEQGRGMRYSDVAIRNAYPPSTRGMNGGLNFYHWGWEESVIPKNFIENFNHDLNGIGTMSQYVTEKLIENGIQIPVQTMGEGVELPKNFDQIAPYPLKTKKRFKFLHISSAFPRKGVDVLLRGFYEAFTQNDDVCLVLKTFPNPHNNVADLLAELNREFKNPPEVEWIDHDLPQEKLFGLYKAADCYVSMARGEGFGLPVAEAMLAKLPVIVAANSGMLDFCHADTAFLVPCKLVEAHTHFSGNNGDRKSYWYEPERAVLVSHLKSFVAGEYEKEAAGKVEAAYQLIRQKFSWSAVAERWEKFIQDVENHQYRPKVAMVTTWNSKCGIAEYSRMEVEASEKMVDYEIFANKGVELVRKDEPYVHDRVWKLFDVETGHLVKELLNSDCEIVHFQYSPGFVSAGVLGHAIEGLAKNKKIIVTFHETEALGMKRDFVKALNKCAAIVLHQSKDIERMRASGIRRNLLRLIPLGQLAMPETPVEVRRNQLSIDEHPVIGSYGFLLPHKGVKETIMAMPYILEKYPDALYMPICALYPKPESEAYYRECQDEVERLNLNEHVKLVTDFLSNDKSMAYLQSCDVISFAYGYTEQSASGAVRFGFAASRPVLTTKQAIFDEFKDFAYQIVSNEPHAIAEEILKILDQKNAERNEERLKKQKQYIRERSWFETAKTFYELYVKCLKEDCKNGNQ